MDIHTATEEAYKKGYEQGKKDAVVQGRWGVEVGMNWFKERICPVCKKHIESNFWNHCPNCGADMRGAADER